jgi:hypothetical protein
LLVIEIGIHDYITAIIMNAIFFNKIERVI